MISENADMYNYFSAALASNGSCYYIDNLENPDFGPPTVGDTVVVRAAERIDFYILVERITAARLYGELVFIEPGPRGTFEGWCLGAEISVDELKITAIIRQD